MVKFNWPVIGHQSVQKYLQSIIKQQHLHHAYLFYGPAGVGKSLTAEYFIKSLYCHQQTLSPCGQCVACRQIKHSVHPDIFYLEKAADKKNITVEQVRDVRQWAQQSSLSGSYKVVLIKQAHHLSLAASNALLKILEEPPAQTIFILLTPFLELIPQTIISRTQLIKFSPLPFKELEQALINKGMDEKQAQLLARLSRGLPGEALPLVNSPQALETYYQRFKDIFKIISADLTQRFKAVEKISAQSNAEASKKQVKDFLNLFSVLMRDLFLIKNNCHQHISCSYLESDLLRQAEQYKLKQIVNILDSIQQAYKLIEKNINLRLTLESLMLALPD